MFYWHRVSRKIQLGIIGVAALAAFAACGGGASGGTHPLPVSSPPAPPGGTVVQASISVPATETGVPIPLPALPGIMGTVTLPGNDAAPGTSITITTSATLPSFVSGTPESGSVIFLTITLSAASNITFQKGGPNFAVTLSQPPANRGAYYAWMYDSVHAWRNFAALHVSGNTLTFGDGDTQISLLAGVPTVIVPLTASATAGCPTPPPVVCSPIPTTSSPMPPAPQLYFTGQTTGGRCPVVSVYDEDGHRLLTNSAFPNLTPAGVDYARLAGIAFDPFNQHLYVSEDFFFTGGYATAAIRVYDRNGNRVPTSGDFRGLTTGGPVLFDPLNRRIYGATRFTDIIRVYDEDGHQISTPGTFPTLGADVRGLTFDPVNRRIYAALCCIGFIGVYDENGNPVTTSGSFPNVRYPQGITFDAVNHRLYVANAIDPVTVYDEEGNQIADGAFRGPYIGDRLGIAYDGSTRRVYVLGTVGVAPFDEAGNFITTAGSFFNNTEFAPAALVPVPPSP